MKYNHSCLSRGCGGTIAFPKSKKFGQNQNFSGIDNELFGKDKVTQFRTIQISQEKN